MKFKPCEFWINQSGYPPIKVDGFAVEFDVAERCPERFAVRYDDFFGWRATHWETGFAIGWYYDSREECATAVLERLTRDPAVTARAVARARGRA